MCYFEHSFCLTEQVGLISRKGMRSSRWLIEPYQESKITFFYHTISRIVDRRFVLQSTEKEKLRMFMRMYENFSGCRIVAYCFMCNHIHLLLEVPPMPLEGLSDAELLRRLSAIYTEAFVAEIAKELADARQKVADGLAEETQLVGRIHRRFTYRMHNLSEFMKGFLQRYTQWHNRTHKRCGHLWEDRFKSIIVQGGAASKAIAAYIDLNPVRAGMVKMPEDYRWSSYGEAIGGSAKGDGKKARAGLVRALRAHKGIVADANLWNADVSLEYRRILLAGAESKVEERVEQSGKMKKILKRKGLSKEHLDVERQKLIEAEEKRLGELPFGRMLRCKIRYFTAGAVVGQKEFVEDVFQKSRHRFGPKRTSGARTMRGNASAARGLLWAIRDLRKN